MCNRCLLLPGLMVPSHVWGSLLAPQLPGLRSVPWAAVAWWLTAASLSLCSHRYGADVDVDHRLDPETRPPCSRRLTSLVVCPLYISAAYRHLQCFRLLLQAGANPDFNCDGPVNTQGLSRGSPGCVMDAVLRHGCEAAFVSLLVDFGADLNLVKWESLGPESRGRRKVDPEALQVFKEARSEWPRFTSALLFVCVN